MNIRPGALYWIARGKQRILAVAVGYAGGGFAKVRTYRRRGGWWEQPPRLVPVSLFVKRAGDTDPRVTRALARADSALADMLLTTRPAPRRRAPRRKARHG